MKLVLMKCYDSIIIMFDTIQNEFKINLRHEVVFVYAGQQVVRRQGRLGRGVRQVQQRRQRGQRHARHARRGRRPHAATARLNVYSILKYIHLNDDK